MIRFIFFSTLLLVVSACNNELADRLQSGRVMGVIGIDGRWAGPVTPSTENCGTATTGVMTVAGKTFAFDPFQGTTIIKGSVSDADMQGTLSRPGNGQQLVSITFTGAAEKSGTEGDTISGRLESGHCYWTVSLKRA